ncbi:glucosaminidase domain-containing protein [Pelagibacterales bacterium SAG-MED17]|nr:glucosaminidase domain-containing protein [Pelagibacterales bacterium SAG-MED17]
MREKNFKKQDRSNLNFFKTLLTSLIIIFIFSVLPNSAKFIKNNLKSNEIVFNSSKQNFDETLDKKRKKNIKIKEAINDRFSWNIFDDIDVFGKDEEDENPQRLSASTIEELFKDNGYNLDTVKKTKLVNVGNQLTKLPKELKNIQSPKKRKKLFIQIVLPLIIEENLKIRFDRKKLFKILNKNNTSKRDKSWLDLKFKQYGVKNNDLTKLKIRMDEIPVSLAIAQAAKETGWGSSRFAQEGNALFGQWTWSGEGIKPLDVGKDKKHKVAKFKILKASVRAYQRNLNTHPSYKQFRIERAIQRDNDEKLESLKLVNFLEKYAETGKEYTEVLKQIINQNSLTDFDDVDILPTSLKMKNLI